ncbi:hypothetical protein FISHEDRAFT_71172 [Fistulina hepatica ATCC 64428]|nr:hypothetical protein FISHEDRAFT_71172 [Fistulina hepatica ATCC 64428]
MSSLWVSYLSFVVTLISVVCGNVLVDFQVVQPPVVPKGVQECTVKVLEHTFGNSYGHSEIVDLVPPTDCGTPGEWSAITLNFTVTSNGTQYDRLGIFTFHNVEIWRTSTPEPTTDGIIWTYIKDVTQYMPLFAENGTFILELDNIVDSSLTGEYATVLYATYYAATDAYPAADKADKIIPLSTLANTTGDDASVPPAFSTNVTVPVNTVAIYAELFASGNGDEEFWYASVANEFLDDLPEDYAYGDGPFREVRLLVDGYVAGVAFPYPVVFTGGWSPASWRPITSYGALDLPTYVIDVTPFVPMLTDGETHNFTIDVASAESNHSILSNWYVSGNLKVVTDSSSSATTGNITTYSADDYAVSTVSGAFTGDAGSVTVTASRKIYIESDILSGSGVSTHVIWTQELEYSNLQTYSDDWLVEVINQTSTGTSTSLHNNVTVVSDKFSYPCNIDFVYLSDEYTNWTFYMDHSYVRDLQASPLVRGTTIDNLQTTFSLFQETSTGNYGYGLNNNTFYYEDTDGNTFSRRVNAAYNNVTLDIVGGSLAEQFVTSNATEITLFAAARRPGLPLVAGVA